MTDRGAGRLSCPFCAAYDVSRLYLASLNVDSCECMCCGAQWDESTDHRVVQSRRQSKAVTLPG